jgi:branched-subunit amino acid aminotransferase/4-amino-4-deoxychorismate lyase
MYIRPTMIATQKTLGVSATSAAKLFVILSPVGAYYSGGFKPIRLLADDEYVPHRSPRRHHPVASLYFGEASNTTVESGVTR